MMTSVDDITLETLYDIARPEKYTSSYYQVVHTLMDLLYAVGVNVHNNPVKEFKREDVQYSCTTKRLAKQWEMLRAHVNGNVYELMDDLTSLIDFIQNRKYKYKMVMDI